MAIAAKRRQTEEECRAGYQIFNPDEAGYDDEAEKALQVFAADFYKNKDALVQQYLTYFFRDKTSCCGGPIPNKLLTCPRRLNMVVNYDIIKGVDRAYKVLEPLLSQEEIERSERTGEATSDIKLVNETLNLLARSGIPQQFAGGMMLLYLEFVEGVEIGDEP